METLEKQVKGEDLKLKFKQEVKEKIEALLRTNIYRQKKGRPAITCITIDEKEIQPDEAQALVAGVENGILRIEKIHTQCVDRHYLPDAILVGDSDISYNRTSWNWLIEDANGRIMF